ncbi:MAG TPA: sugar phosphate nucleotidyltransferase, partial [bacterium]
GQYDGVEKVTGMVEKPPRGQEPSRLIALGRYLYTPELFDALRVTYAARPKSKEFTQTDAINHLASKGRVVVHRFDGKLMDVGTPRGYLNAFIEYGLSRKEFRADLLAYMRTVLAREGGK